MSNIRKDLVCRICGSEEFEDVSPVVQTTGGFIIGPGGSRKLVDLWACVKCRIVVSPTTPVPQEKEEPSLNESCDISPARDIEEPLDKGEVQSFGII